jgi:hypothetical protein
VVGKLIIYAGDPESYTAFISPEPASLDNILILGENTANKATTITSAMTILA